MNLELITISRARAFCAELTKRGIGGGVAKEILNEDGTPNLDAWADSGIYLDPWTPVDSSPVPGFADMKPYQVHFVNGVANVSIGLMVEMFNPQHGRTVENTWAYIKEQVDGLAKLL